MKIALVHDYLIQDGGAERVLQAFQEIWPEAPIFALMHDPKKLGPRFRGSDIRTTFLQKIPFAGTHYKWLMPLMPLATEQHNLSGYDVVLTSTSAFAKGVITDPDTLHICYCHTPTRYLWSDTHSYSTDTGIRFPIRQMLPPVLAAVRVWDRLAADRVDRFIANSDTVRRRIRKFYQRESTVIHPPVDTARFHVSPKIGNYFLAGGRLVAYKRFDLIVKTFNKLGLPLIIFGEGPESKTLRTSARKNITFVGKISDREKASLYASAIAYLHPQEEDFGITAVEAMSAGRPVIAYGKGGAAETVIDGITGIHLNDQSWEELANAIVCFTPENFNPQAIREHAEQFDVDIFKQRIEDLVRTEWKNWQTTEHGITIPIRHERELAR